MVVFFIALILSAYLFLIGDFMFVVSAPIVFAILGLAAAVFERDLQKNENN